MDIIRELPTHWEEPENPSIYMALKFKVSLKSKNMPRLI